jgi:hypothetical protein
VDPIGCGRRTGISRRDGSGGGENRYQTWRLEFCSLFVQDKPLRDAAMDSDISRLKQNIARLRRDIRLQALELQQLIDSDLDCTGSAQRLMRMQADLVLFIAKRERLKSPATA